LLIRNATTPAIARTTTTATSQILVLRDMCLPR
jgi:hypothetical protein